MFRFDFLILFLSIIHGCSSDCSTIAGCTTCSNPGVKCGMCRGDTTPSLDGSECLDCAKGCDDCSVNSTGVFCADCGPGQYFCTESTDCMNCAPKCTSCEDKSTCKACMEGYHLSAPSCKECHSSCAMCDNAMSCTSCQPGYQINAYMICEACSNYVPNCAACLDGVCSECSSGYYLDDINCVECIGSCMTCENKNTCEKCKPGFFLNTAKDTCSNVMHCSEYKDGQGCIKCNDGFHLLQDGKCLPCPVLNAYTCRTCITATNGHYFANDECFECLENCLLCPDAESCDQCVPDTVWDSATKACVSCKTATLDSTNCASCNGKYWDGDSCEGCPEDLNAAMSVAVCTQCLSAFWQIGKCTDVDCSATDLTQPECMSCKDSKRWEATTSKCLDLRCESDAITETECGVCEAKKWVPDYCGAPDCSNLVYDNELACEHCLFRRWDEANGVCKGLTCSADSTQEECGLCTSFKWNSGTSVCEFNFVDCQNSALTDPDDCKACVTLGYYWEGGICKQSTPQSCTTADTKLHCNSCRNKHWNGTACADVVCEGQLDSESKCLKCSGSYWNSTDSQCLAVLCDFPMPTTKEACMACPAMKWDSGAKTCGYLTTCNAPPSIEEDCFECRLFGYKWNKGTSICDSNSCVNHGYTTQDDCKWCSPFSAFVPAHCEAIDCDKTKVEADCDKCPNHIWNAGSNTCEGIKCNSEPTTELECRVCNGTTMYWDGAKCVGKFNCSTTFIKSEEMCSSCSEKKVGKLWSDGQGHCVACPAGCISCDPDNECLKCEDGKIWNPMTRMCDDCKTALLVTEQTCGKCPGRVWQEKTCEKCPDKCHACSKKDSCDQCAEEGMVWSAAAKMCSSCILVTKTECEQCETKMKGNYIDGNNECQGCPVGCKGCDSYTKCTECAMGFYLVTTPAAGQTPESTTCSACSGLAKDDLDDMPKCKGCGSAHKKYWVDTAKKCEDCDTNCLTCSPESGCLVCKDGFHVNNGACEACIAGCDKCEDSTTCLMCSSGFCLDVDATACHQTPNNFPPCKKCKSKANPNGSGNIVECTMCPSDQYMEMCQACKVDNCKDCSRNIEECSSCDGGYYLNAQDKCSKCPAYPLCAECTGMSKCDKCKSGYNANGNKCEACIAGCAECSDTTTCTKCFYKKAYDSTNKKCVDCSAGCDACSSETECTKCSPGFYLDNGSCKECSKAIDKCAICDKKDKCMICEDGYGTNEAGTACSKCEIDKCGMCVDPPLQCDVCEEGKMYDVKDGTCVDACYSCSGDVACGAAQGPKSGMVACKGVGETHSCWTEVDIEGDLEDGGIATFHRKCSNETCTADLGEDFCKDITNKKNCKFCCKEGLCNAQVLADALESKSKAVAITSNTWAFLLAIVLSAFGTARLR